MYTDLVFVCVNVFSRVHRIKKDRRQKESQRKQKAAECRKHLTNIRFAIYLCLGSRKSVFKPPPAVGAGGGYMFSGHPSVPLSMRPCVRACVHP